MHLTPAANITRLRQHTSQKRGILTNFGCDDSAILFTMIISMADVTMLYGSFTIPINSSLGKGGIQKSGFGNPWKGLKLSLPRLEEVGSSVAPFILNL